MTFQALLAFSDAILCSGLAVVVFWRAPHAFVHRTFAAGMCTLAWMNVCAGIGAQATLPLEVIRWERLRMVAAALLPGIWLLFSLSFARTNYQIYLRRWRWGLLAAFILPLGTVIGFPHTLFATGSLDKITEPGMIPLGWSGYSFYLIFLCSSLIIVSHLEMTLRVSAGRIRRQIKFVILGIGSLFAVQIYKSTQVLLLESVYLYLSIVDSITIFIAIVLIIIAIYKRKPLDIEIYISRTFLYNSVVLLGISIYLLFVGIIFRVINNIDRDAILPLGISFVFLALLTLTIALLSEQLQHNIKQFINRHFYRSHYDYRMVWTACTQRMTSVVEIEELCVAVSRMISDIFAAPSVTLWLVDEERQGRLILGGSTVFWDRRGLPSGWVETAAALVTFLGQHTLPVDLTLPTTPGLQPTQRDVLRRAQIRYGIALTAGQQLLGIITLSDRLTQEAFSVEDFDLLKTVADQAAASLLNLQLSQHLLRAKEMEAWQTVSGFFVHDLKNVAAKLSLMVQNLPIHYDNPVFRDDMLRVISASVTKMNVMCSRLSLLTKRIELHLTEADLNELVHTALAELDGTWQGIVHRELQPMPPVRMDTEQFQKVLNNLLLNALEAMGRDGELRVATARSDRWAVLTVSDNGCGMSQACLTRCLFEPFQTTKSQGLGIGMFHSKMIVEAHQGKIEVESVEGQGSTFRVFLPLVAPPVQDGRPLVAVEPPHATRSLET